MENQWFAYENDLWWLSISSLVFGMVICQSTISRIFVVAERLSDKCAGADHGSPAAKSDAPSARAGVCRQLAILFHRELVNVKRNKALTVARAVQSIMSSLLIGLIFLQLERNMSSLSPRLFSSFFLVWAQLLGKRFRVLSSWQMTFRRSCIECIVNPINGWSTVYSL